MNDTAALGATVLIAMLW